MNEKLIFDAHTHLNDDSYERDGITVKKLIQEAEKVGVGYFLDVAYDLESAESAIKHAHEFPNVYAAVGIHPMDVDKFKPTALKEIEQLARDSKVVAIGEVGLDYYWKKDNHEEQKQWFIDQMKIAEKHNLVLMMHIRDERGEYQAYDQILQILQNYKLPRMIVHCFSADASYAQRFLDLGCYVNIGGAVTFKNAHELHEAVKIIPLDRLLVETDAPYLSPHPFRGQKNFPKMITYTVEKIAELKEISSEEVIQTTTKNAFKIFGLT